MSFAGSSSAQEGAPLKFGVRTGIPLYPCPKYGEEILELTTAEDSKVPGAMFFKCQLHERDVPGTCPWYLFANKYKKMLLSKGLIQMGGTGAATMKHGVSVGVQGDHRIAFGCQEGLLQADKPEMAPLLFPMHNGSDGVDEKLQKLIGLGKISVVCLIVMAVLVAVLVVIMLVK